MFVTFPVSGSAVAKVLGSLAVVLAVAAGCAVGSSDDSNEARPSSSTSANTQPSPSVTGASSTTTTEPSASPSTSQPEASPSESSDVSTRPGKVVAAFEDGPKGPFLVLVPIDESQSDLEYSASMRDSLRNLDVTALPVSTAWKVDVSADVFQSCAPDEARKVFQDYPSCAGSADTADTAPTSTDR
ncbi:hypothetical protein ACQEU6_44880 [Spirillospora sp. CA-108201]